MNEGERGQDSGERNSGEEETVSWWYFTCRQCRSKWVAAERIRRCPVCGEATVALQRVEPVRPR
jgi:rubrerythrin